MRVLVTGARGWIGRAVCAALREHGHEVVAYDIKDGDDIGNAGALAGAMRGCEAVAHLAGIPHPSPRLDWEAYWQHNVAGTQAVADLAEGNGLRRLVYASSTAYYGAQKGFPLGKGVLAEGSANGVQRCAGKVLPDMAEPYNRAAVAYMCSKVAAETVLAAYGLAQRLQVVILRLAPMPADGQPWGEWGLFCTRERAAAAVVTALEAPGERWYEVYNVAEPDVAKVSTTRLRALEV